MIVYISFGTEVVHANSSKQKIKTESSTEAELVGVSDYLLYHTWLENFFKYQGHHVAKKALFLDNQSDVKMEVNGQNSCTSNSCHVYIRFFFVHDCVKSGKLNLSDKFLSS